MFSLAAEVPSANPYVEKLSQLPGGQQASAECLIIAHSDPGMIHRLSGALSPDAVLLQVPQSSWDFHGEKLPETVDWVLRAGNLKQLMLAGHSQGAAWRTEASLLHQDLQGSGAETAARDSAYDRLLSRVSLAQQRLADAKHQFAEQFHRLAEIPAVKQRVNAGALEVHGLFYLAESGTFLSFEVSTGSFHPLVDPNSGA